MYKRKFAGAERAGLVKRSNVGRVSLLALKRARKNPVSQQAKRVGGWANPSAGSELKFIDTTPSSTVTASSGAFSALTLLNGCIPGSTATDRIGRKVVLKSVYFRYVASLATTSTQGGALRIIIFYDKQANASTPAITDLLLADTFASPNNLSNRDRFVVICDEITEPISAGNNFQIAGNIWKRLNLETMFNAGTAGTVADITTGALYMAFAQSAGIATAAPTLGGRIRVRFDDI